MKKKLSAQYLLKITKIFEDNGWPIEDSEDAHNSHFNRYCERICEVGENKKKDLILDLTTRYLWIQQSKYLDYLIDALTSMIDNKPQINECEKIYVTQLISPDEKNNVKSSTMLVYLFNDVKLRYNSKTSKIKFEILNEISQLPSNFKEKNEFLLIVDDYIGTGNTAEKCIKGLIASDIPLDKTIICSIVAQECGINLIKKYNVYTTVSVIREKGISDYYLGETLDENKDLMVEIEKNLGTKREYRFGYGDSESLVTMCRTPNNTFPIFWQENNNMKVAPFPRF